MTSQGATRPGRMPLTARRRAERHAARRRVAVRTKEAMTAAQKAYDPIFRARSPWSARLLVIAAFVLASGAVHGSVIGIGVLVSGDDGDRTVRERVQVEIRERAEKKEPDKKKPEPEKKQPEKKTAAVTVDKPRTTEKKAKPPEPPPTDQPEARRPPPRVVGISMEATVDSGGGVEFAVGNTRAGETADRAVDPRLVPKKPGAEDEVDRKPVEQPKAARSNRQAARIPTTGAKLVLPKRKQPSKPDYPETLKAQGIEADVPVLVSIDETGKVTEVRILKSSGYPAFDDAARAAALAESFEPAMKDGKAIPYQLSFTYRFRLEDQ